MIAFITIVFAAGGTADVQFITVKAAAAGNLVIAPFFHIASHI
jgi:hypothetical protein